MSVCRHCRKDHEYTDGKCVPQSWRQPTDPRGTVTKSVTPCNACATKGQRIAELERQIAAAVALYANGPKRNAMTSAERVRRFRERQRAKA